MVCFFEIYFYIFFHFVFYLSDVRLSSNVWWSLIVGSYMSIAQKEADSKLGVWIGLVMMLPWMVIWLGCVLGETLTLAPLRAGHMQEWRIFQSSSGKGQAWLPHHMEKDPEISNIQLVKLTKSICFPYDNYTACGSWKFSVQRLPSPLALGNETWFSIKMREEQFILLRENARESEAPTAS